MSKTLKWIIIGVVIFVLLACIFCAIAGGSLIIFSSGEFLSTRVEVTTTPPDEMGIIEATEEIVLEPTPNPEEMTPTDEEPENADSTPLPEATPAPAERADFDDYAPVMAEAWQLANQYFVDQPIDGELLIEGAIRGMRESLPQEHPMYLAYDLEAYTVSSGAEASVNSSPAFEEYNQPLKDAWNQAYDEAGNLPLDPNLLIQGAMRGMMVSLGDRYSMYLSPSELTQLNISQSGEYEGIGAWVDTSGEYITIISPMAGSPAEEAGLKTGDIVIAIDGEDMTGINPDIALQRILGPAGSIIVLTVEREGEPEPLDIEITRAKITVPSVEYEMLEGNIGYLQLYNFGENTSEDFIAALSDLLDQGAEGLIFDMRGNGGGFLFTAVNILSQFIEGNTPVIYQEYGDGTEDVWESNPGGIGLDIPMVVLADGGSASASEITIGALQDLDRATIIGTTTFGKGSVHYVLPLSNENGAVQVTIARWLTPDKRYIHEVGIDPDIVVEFDEDAFEADGTDNQLQKALEVIQEMIP